MAACYKTCIRRVTEVIPSVCKHYASWWKICDICTQNLYTTTLRTIITAFWSFVNKLTVALLIHLHIHIVCTIRIVLFQKNIKSSYPLWVCPWSSQLQLTVRYFWIRNIIGNEHQIPHVKYIMRFIKISNSSLKVVWFTEKVGSHVSELAASTVFHQISP